MKLFLLDTCILIDYLRGKKGAVDFLESLDRPPAISVLTISELFDGVRNEKEQIIIRDLIASLEVFEFNDVVAESGGLLRQKFYKSHGTGILDALLAATALENDLTLVTLNIKHFPMLDNVLVPYAA